MRIFVVGPEGTGNTFLRKSLGRLAGVIADGDSLPNYRPPIWFDLSVVAGADRIVLTSRPEAASVFSAWRRFADRTPGGVAQLVWQYRAALLWQRACLAAHGDRCLVVTYDDLCRDPDGVFSCILGRRTQCPLPVQRSQQVWKQHAEFVAEYEAAAKYPTLTS